VPDTTTVSIHLDHSVGAALANLEGRLLNVLELTRKLAYRDNRAVAAVDALKAMESDLQKAKQNVGWVAPQVMQFTKPPLWTEVLLRGTDLHRTLRFRNVGGYLDPTGFNPCHYRIYDVAGGSVLHSASGGELTVNTEHVDINILNGVVEPLLAARNNAAAWHEFSWTVDGVETVMTQGTIGLV
jgi:hypothetical protein